MLDAAGLPLCTAALPMLSATMCESEQARAMDEIGLWQDSLHFLRSRCSLVIIAAGSLASRCNVQYERYMAPRGLGGRDPSSDGTPA